MTAPCTPYAPRRQQAPEIRYRLLTDDSTGEWHVRWLCGSRWVLVCGPCSEAAARDWLDGMQGQVIWNTD